MDILTEYFLSLVTEEELDTFTKRLLLCGGAYGHLSHPYEDMGITFADMKDIINSALSGNIKADEKIDGQNLMFTWKNGELRAARNKGHIKNYGENSLTKNQLDVMFADRPPQIRQAFVYAMTDLETALSMVDEKQLNEIFQDGKRFMNVEVVLPATQNVIPYGLSLLVFHGTVEYDQSGNPVGVGIIDAGEYLDKIIKNVNSNVQKHFTLRGPNRIILKQVKDFQQKKKEYLSIVKKLQGTLPDTATLEDYHRLVWSEMIREKSKEFKYSVSDIVVSQLVNRWVSEDKTIRIVKLQKEIESEEFKQWIQQVDRQRDLYFKKLNQPFEYLFLKLGVDVLSNASGYLAASPDKAAREVSAKTQEEIEKIKQLNDPEAMSKLERELERIKHLGGLEHMSGTEGIAFYRNGKVYKLVGSFAPVGQILGMIRYKR